MMNIKKILLLLCCVIFVGVFVHAFKQKILPQHVQPRTVLKHDEEKQREDLFQRCKALHKQSQFNASFEVCQRFITHYESASTADEGEVQWLLLAAYALQTDNLLELKKYAEAIKSIDATIPMLYRVRGANELKAQEFIAEGKLKKAVLLSESSKNDNEQLALLTEVIGEFAPPTSPKMQRIVVFAYMQQAYLFDELKRKAEMQHNYDLVIKNYATNEQSSIRELVADAYLGRGFESFLMAKQQWTSDRKKALQLLSRAQQDFDQSFQFTQSDETRALLYGNQAYSFWLLGDTVQAELKLKQALMLDGEYIYQVTLDDIKQYPTSMDAGFKALLERLWAIQKSPEINQNV